MFHSTQRICLRFYISVLVWCGEELLAMHNLKSVVTCGSEYFRAMLEHEMAESAGKSWTDFFD